MFRHNSSLCYSGYGCKDRDAWQEVVTLLGRQLPAQARRRLSARQPKLSANGRAVWPASRPACPKNTSLLVGNAPLLGCPLPAEQASGCLAKRVKYRLADIKHGQLVWKVVMSMCRNAPTCDSPRSQESHSRPVASNWGVLHGIGWGIG